MANNTPTMLPGLHSLVASGIGSEKDPSPSMDLFIPIQTICVQCEHCHKISMTNTRICLASPRPKSDSVTGSQILPELVNKEEKTIKRYMECVDKNRYFRCVNYKPKWPWWKKYVDYQPTAKWYSKLIMRWKGLK